LFHCGADAPYYVWGWREDGPPTGITRRGSG
jgi:hypothetical protein